MNREPISLYIFRIMLGIGLFAFMCMLYWSSLLVENHLLSLKEDLSGMKSDISSIRIEIEKAIEEIKNFKNQDSANKEEENQNKPGHTAKDNDYQNLLKKDPFYENVLPHLLGKNFKPYGTFHDATIGKPFDLHPFSNWSQVGGWREMCGLTAARMQFGKYESFSPDMAIKIEARMRKDAPVPEYWVFLRDNVYWQPLNEQMFSNKVRLAPQFLKRHKVTAHDFKFFFDAVMNPFVQKPGAVALRNYIGDIEQIEVLDDLTFVVRWRVHDVEEAGKKVPKIRYIAKMWTGSLNPLPGFVFKYFSDGTKIVEDDSDPDTYRKNFIWAQNFSEHWAKNVIVSCGPWIFEEFTDTHIQFRRNPFHFFPLDCLVGKSIVEFKSSPTNIWNEFQINKLDSYLLGPDQLLEWKDFLQSPIYHNQARSGKAIKHLDYFERSYTYIAWNMAKPYFKSENVRRAMTMAIDRNRIIKEFLNGFGLEITGPFYPFSSSYDKSIQPWPFDPHRAKDLLAQEGWYDSTGTGILDKLIDGKRVPFEFRLTYYVKNPTSKAICDYAATALKEIGIICHLNGVDLADISAAFDDKSFDALCLGWMLGTPPEDPRQLWYSSGAQEPGSSNAVGFINPQADKIIDALEFEDNPEERIKLYHRFHRIIHDSQPYTFLYVPKRMLLYREYLQNVFIPADKQDLIPGADVEEPVPSIFWIRKEV